MKYSDSVKAIGIFGLFVDIIGSIICSIIIMGTNFFLGFLVLCIGLFVGYVIFTLFSAFSHVVLRVDDINNNLEKLLSQLNIQISYSNEIPRNNEKTPNNLQTTNQVEKMEIKPFVTISNNQNIWICKKCSTRNEKYAQYCSSCGEYR